MYKGTQERSLGERVLVWSDQWSWISLSFRVTDVSNWVVFCLFSLWWCSWYCWYTSSSSSSSSCHSICFFILLFFFCWMLLYASVICLKWSFNLFIRYGWSKLIIAFLKKLYNVYGLRFWLLRLLYYYVYFLASCFHLMNLPNIFIFYHKYACMEEKGENLYCSVLSSRISSIWVKIIEG